MVYDPLKMESGLLDDATITIQECLWTFDEGYDNGNTCVMKWLFTSEDDDVDDDTELLFPCNNFEPVDEGRRAQREDGKEKNWNNRGGAGIMTKSLIEQAEDVMRGRAEAGFTPQMAEFYEGLTIHIGRVEVNYGEEIGKKDRLVCTEFISATEPGEAAAAPAKSAAKKVAPAGAKKAGAAKKAGPAKKAAAKKAAAPVVEETEEDNGTFGLDPELFQALSDLADTCETHEEFAERAVGEIDGVAGDEAVEAVVALNGEGDESIWGQACERAS